MLGKRSRSMSRIASGIAMGLECALVDSVPPAEQVTEKQSSLRFSSACPPRVIIGFCPKARLQKEEDEKSLPETSPSGRVQNNGSPKSRPTSGLESLRSSPRPSVEKNMRTTGLGLQVALSPDPDLPMTKAHDHVSSKTGVMECGITGDRMSVNYSHIPPCSELKQLRPCTSGGTFKQSHPIPIAQSPRYQATAPCKAQPQQSPDYRNQRENSESGNTRSAQRFAEDCVQYDRRVQEVEKCIFSLPTSPGTYEDAYSLISLASMDFMEACFLCQRRLGQGHDIFMYKGDKAFCSDECRYQQILIDEHAERREKCSSVALKAGTAVQSRRSKHKTSVLSASTAAAA